MPKPKKSGNLLSLISNKLPKNNIRLVSNLQLKRRLKKVDNLALAALSFIFISLTSLNLNTQTVAVTQTPKTLGEAVESDLVQSKKNWEIYLKENPRYIDGWLEIARIEYELGNFTGAIKALDQAKRINPNLFKVQELENELGV